MQNNKCTCKKRYMINSSGNNQWYKINNNYCNSYIHKCVCKGDPLDCHSYKHKCVCNFNIMYCKAKHINNSINYTSLGCLCYIDPLICKYKQGPHMCTCISNGAKTCRSLMFKCDCSCYIDTNWCKAFSHECTCYKDKIKCKKRYHCCNSCIIL